MPIRSSLCYANAALRKDEQNDEILTVVSFWRSSTERFPANLILHSKLTTYANLDVLNQLGSFVSSCFAEDRKNFWMKS